MTIIKESIIKYYQWASEKNKPVNLAGYYDFINIDEQNIIQGERKKYFDFSSFRLVFEEYAHGSKKYLLNGEKEFDIINDKFIVFDLEALEKSDKELFNIITLLIVELVIKKIQKLQGVRKTFLIDEALNFLEDEKMGEFIAYLYRTFRKKEVQVKLAMQNINFFDSVPKLIRDSILINSDTRCILGHSSNQESYKDFLRFGITDQDGIAMLDKTPLRHVFIQMGAKKLVLKHEVSLFAQCVFTSKESEKLKIYQNFEKTGYMP